ncbi:MAG TPA: glycosyltransferase family 2 protein [Candidatus Paceibacterota bacterium]|nr:glycosyltransferase family 2 protein [Candidatus Paceibacterota bacterium]
MVKNLLADIVRCTADVDVILTCNIPESEDIGVTGLKQFQRLDNSSCKGFGANHNEAFLYCHEPFYCIANPDIRLLSDLFPDLISCMNDPRVGLVVPRVISPMGNVEDSVRYFPTLARLAAKALRLEDGRFPVSCETPDKVDWAAGMFMLFRAEAFREIGGFDEDFFLYYEDVNICARLWKAGWKVIHHPGVSVVHAAQRASRKNLRYLKWHITSMARYFWKHWGRLPRKSVS